MRLLEWLRTKWIIAMRRIQMADAMLWILAWSGELWPEEHVDGFCLVYGWSLRVRALSPQVFWASDALDAVAQAQRTAIRITGSKWPQPKREIANSKGEASDG